MDRIMLQMVSLLGPACALAGAIVGTCEGLRRASVLLLSQSQLEAGRRSEPALRDLPALLDGVQLTHDTKAPALPDPCVQCCLTAAADLHAVNTFVDAVFAVATKRAAKTAAWAGEYARLCARFRAAAWPVKLDEPFAEALHGRSVQEYTRICSRTVAVDVRGQSKHADQVASEAGELRGGLRFLAALLKEHLLPLALIHAAVVDLMSHTAPGPAGVHSQPMLALALASLLQGCVDAYVCEGVVSSGSAEKPDVAAAESHIKALGRALLRLQKRVGAQLPELKAELEDLHFKLVSYASTVFPATAHAQQAQHAHGPPLLQPHFMPRRSEDLLWGAMRPAGDHLLPRWPSAQLPPN